MTQSQSFWSWIRPNMTFRLLLISLFLIMVALGNLAATYESFTQQNLREAMLYFIVVLIYAVPAYGIFRLKRWARKLELVLSSIMIVFGIILLLFASIGTGIMVMILHGLIVAYLLSKESREAFGESIR